MRDPDFAIGDAVKRIKDAYYGGDLFAPKAEQITFAEGD